MDLLHSIDKQVGITNQKVESLDRNIEDHKESDKARRTAQAAWEIRMEDAVRECPEAKHIKEQNGKLDRLTLLTKSLALLGAGILVLGAAASVFFGFWNHSSKAAPVISSSIPVDQVQYKYVYELEEED